MMPLSLPHVYETTDHVLTAMAGPRLFNLKKIADDRGYFAEMYHAERYINLGLPSETLFCQDNTSLSKEAGVIRGLHFQTPPYAQGKLIACLQGALLDIAVDIRRHSPTYGQHIAVVLSEDNARQLWIPAGFAHGFCTLVANTLVTYKVTAPYAAAHDKGLAWHDPALGIKWPFPEEACQLSPKDQTHPLLKDLPTYFT
jgi:dTDP-4-dehydrorhamnose 3,5-epimerase